MLGPAVLAKYLTLYPVYF